MLTDPTGSSLQMDDVLPLLPVGDYTLPGLFLLFVMGAGPLFLIYGLLARPNRTRTGEPSHGAGHHWAWTGTIALGGLLMLWLVVQGVLIGFKWPIQYVTAVNGVLIIAVALVPRVKRLYAK